MEQAQFCLHMQFRLGLKCLPVWTSVPCVHTLGSFPLTRFGNEALFYRAYMVCVCVFNTTNSNTSKWPLITSHLLCMWCRKHDFTRTYSSHCVLDIEKMLTCVASGSLQCWSNQLVMEAMSRCVSNGNPLHCTYCHCQQTQDSGKLQMMEMCVITSRMDSDWCECMGLACSTSTKEYAKGMK